VRSDVAVAIAAIRAGQAVILPTDTVYGLAGTALTPEGRDAVYRLKGREHGQPTALVAASIEALLECVPELERSSGAAITALLPGPYTLVLPNPARRFPWLCGSTPDAIGVRVPALSSVAAEVIVAVTAVVATSANLPGGAEPQTLADVSDELRQGAAAAVDGGTLPGIPSTVVDLTGPHPRVLREGAGDLERVLALTT